MERKNSFTVAVMFMLISGFGFAAMGLFVRFAGNISATQKVFFRNIVVFVVSLILLLNQLTFTQIKSQFKDKKNLSILIIRSILGTLGILANFYAVDHMPIASASVLNKISPFFTIIFSALFLKQGITLIQTICILMSFIGVIFISQPSVAGFSNAIPFIIGVSGGIMAGAAYTCVHYLTNRNMSSSFVVCFFHGFSALILLPRLIFSFQPMTLHQIFMIIGIGAMAIIGQYGITLAYKFAKANQVSIFDYSTIVFSTILGLVFLSQIPTLSAVVGMIIVFLAFLIMFFYTKKHETA